MGRFVGDLLDSAIDVVKQPLSGARRARAWVILSPFALLGICFGLFLVFCVFDLGTR